MNRSVMIICLVITWLSYKLILNKDIHHLISKKKIIILYRKGTDPCWYTFNLTISSFLDSVCMAELLFVTKQGTLKLNLNSLK